MNGSCISNPAWTASQKWFLWQVHQSPKQPYNSSTTNLEERPEKANKTMFVVFHILVKQSHLFKTEIYFKAYNKTTPIDGGVRCGCVYALCNAGIRLTTSFSLSIHHLFLGKHSKFFPLALEVCSMKLLSIQSPCPTVSHVDYSLFWNYNSVPVHQSLFSHCDSLQCLEKNTILLSASMRATILESTCVLVPSNFQFLPCCQKGKNLFFFMAEWYSIAYMYHMFFVRWYADGHLSCFCLLTVVNSAVY